MAFCSDEREFENPKATKRWEKQLARLQRRFARQEKGSTRRERTRERIAALHFRISCIRNDALHKATSSIARTKQLSVVVLENLNISGMVKNHCLAKALSDASLSEFRRQVEYKAKRNGVEVVVAPRFYPSSKRCSSCGNVKKELSLSERTYHCDECGFEKDRDWNAALNLREWYFAEFTPSFGECGRGEDVSLGITCGSQQASLKRQVNINLSSG